MKITEAMLTEFLVDQVEDERAKFDELEGYRDHSSTEGLGMYECEIATSCYSVEVLDFTIDEAKKHISGKGIASYTVSAHTTDFYGDEPMSRSLLGEEEAASTFYFEIDLDEDDFAKSYCEIEVGSPCAL